MKKCSACGHIELSDRERDELRHILMLVPATSRDLARQEGLSVSNASNRLTKYAKAGLLVREEVNDKTGGIIFVYHAANYAERKRKEGRP